jgi:hypothetical protein
MFGAGTYLEGAINDHNNALFPNSNRDTRIIIPNNLKSHHLLSPCSIQLTSTENWSGLESAVPLKVGTSTKNVQASDKLHQEFKELAGTRLQSYQDAVGHPLFLLQQQQQRERNFGLSAAGKVGAHGACFLQIVTGGFSIRCIIG